MNGYDIIGDIHGQADALAALLKRLDYRERGGTWTYPGGTRQAIFVGDFIDRNPNARGVLKIVRGMMAEGTAQAVMGNHEFNAIGFHTPDPERPGKYLRVHSEKNNGQHAVFLKEVGGDTAAHDEAIAWFRTLPMWLDLRELRVVHASWVERYRRIAEREAGAGSTLPNALLVKASRKGSEEFDAIECLLKGLEVEMPGAASYMDSYGTVRTRARLRWWRNDPPALVRDAILGSPMMLAQVGEARWRGEWPEDAGYSTDAPPVFIGHYWLDGEPAPLADNVVCVDYSAAKRGKKLVAYRWDGESRLTKAHFVSVPT